MIWDGPAALKRIVEMLFLIAHLADLAAFQSPRTRRRVLETLYEAEILGRRFAGGAVLDLVAAPPQMGPFEPIFMPGGDKPADALSLALRLRALAFLLAQLVILAQLLQRNCQRDDASAGMPSGDDNAPKFTAALGALTVSVVRRMAAIRAPPLALAV